jgi:hypothetical protein
LGSIPLSIIFCIFMTFLYRVIIYKRLFNRSGRTVTCYYRSVSILVSTCVRATLVICHFSWMINNIFIVIKVCTIRDIIGLVVIILTRLSIFIFLGRARLLPSLSPYVPS